ncbi:hypothetical protein PR048_029014 [Dryococelus australis]|uniref:Uncharacterized protein n=1 Tax=Dryococelus australis TaxID=614101 RepID=A0ABQ9GCM0_9NEOP|nr:hypothetical protein PR048_029014 [Dryococelus australis]
MEQHRNARTGKRETPEKPCPNIGIVRHDSHMRKSGSNPAGNRTRTLLGGRRVLAAREHCTPGRSLASRGGDGALDARASVDHALVGLRRGEKLQAGGSLKWLAPTPQMCACVPGIRRVDGDPVSPGVPERRAALFMLILVDLQPARRVSSTTFPPSTSPVSSMPRGATQLHLNNRRSPCGEGTCCRYSAAERGSEVDLPASPTRSWSGQEIGPVVCLLVQLAAAPPRLTRSPRDDSLTGNTHTWEIWAVHNIEVSRAHEGETRRVWSSSGRKWRGKREIPEKTHTVKHFRLGDKWSNHYTTAAPPHTWTFKGYQYPVVIDSSILMPGAAEALWVEHPIVRPRAKQRTARFPPSRARFNPRPVHSGFSQVGIVPDDAAERRVFSGTSHFPRPCIPALLHSHFISPSSVLKTLMARAAQISEFTHSKYRPYNLSSLHERGSHVTMEGHASAGSGGAVGRNHGLHSERRKWVSGAAGTPSRYPHFLAPLLTASFTRGKSTGGSDNLVRWSSSKEEFPVHSKLAGSPNGRPLTRATRQLSAPPPGAHRRAVVAMATHYYEQMESNPSLVPFCAGNAPETNDRLGYYVPVKWRAADGQRALPCRKTSFSQSTPSAERGEVHAIQSRTGIEVGRSPALQGLKSTTIANHKLKRTHGIGEVERKGERAGKTKEGGPSRTKNTPETADIDGSMTTLQGEGVISSIFLTSPQRRRANPRAIRHLDALRSSLFLGTANCYTTLSSRLVFKYAYIDLMDRGCRLISHLGEPGSIHGGVPDFRMKAGLYQTQTLKGGAQEEYTETRRAYVNRALLAFGVKQKKKMCPGLQELRSIGVGFQEDGTRERTSENTYFFSVTDLRL